MNKQFIISSSLQVLAQSPSNFSRAERHDAPSISEDVMLSEEEGGEVVRTIHHQSRTLAPPTNTHESLEPSKAASFPQRSSVLSSPLLDNRHLTGPPRTIFPDVLLNYRLIFSLPFFPRKRKRSYAVLSVFFIWLRKLEHGKGRTSQLASAA